MSRFYSVRGNTVWQAGDFDGNFLLQLNAQRENCRRDAQVRMQSEIGMDDIKEQTENPPCSFDNGVSVRAGKICIFEGEDNTNVPNCYISQEQFYL